MARIASPPHPDLLNFVAIAKLFGVDPRTVRRWRRRPGNPLPAARIGRQVYALRADVLEWVRSLQRDPGPRRLRKVGPATKRPSAIAPRGRA
jgi:hypothetical protein